MLSDASFEDIFTKMDADNNNTIDKAEMTSFIDQYIGLTGNLDDMLTKEI